MAKPNTLDPGNGVALMERGIGKQGQATKWRKFDSVLGKGGQTQKTTCHMLSFM